MNDASNTNGTDSKNWPFSAHLITYANDTPDELAICGSAGSPNELDNPGFLSYTSNPSGGSDGFIQVFNAGLTINNLNRSTFFGGVEFESVVDIAYRNHNQLAISGNINSGATDDAGFPLDNPGNGALFSNQLFSGSNDGFFAEFCQEEPTGIDDAIQTSMDGSLSIYPNPATSSIRVKGKFGSDAKYSVYDISGRNILQKAIHSNDVFEIDISRLSSGAYILKVKSQNSIYTAKFLKQ